MLFTQRIYSIAWLVLQLFTHRQDLPEQRVVRVAWHHSRHVRLGHPQGKFPARGTGRAEQGRVEIKPS